MVNWDVNRFAKLLKQEWIHNVHQGKRGVHGKYVVSSKGKRMINRLYRILLGEERMPEGVRANKIMKREGTADKMYSHLIKKMNKR